MVTELEVYQTAKIVIDKYGDSAIIEAALRQDHLLNEGDLDGARVWSRIGDAIEFLQMKSNLVDWTMH